MIKHDKEKSIGIVVLAGLALAAIAYSLMNRSKRKPVATIDDPFPVARNTMPDDNADLGTKIEHAIEDMHQTNIETSYNGDGDQAEPGF